MTPFGLIARGSRDAIGRLSATARRLLPLVVPMLIVACSDATSVRDTNETGLAYVRIVNAVYRGDDPSSATGLPVDYLIDSSTVAPSILGLAANAMSVGDSANGYVPLPAGVHSFVARAAEGEGPSLYTTYTTFPFLPRQRLTRQTYYTLVAAGLVPTVGNAPDGTVPFIALLDDPFPGPQRGGQYQARFSVINAAPFASETGMGAEVMVYLTSTALPASTLTDQYVPLGYASYRGRSGYFNVDPGTYILTLIASPNSGGPIIPIGLNRRADLGPIGPIGPGGPGGSTGDEGILLVQQPITFGAGDVRTIVLQSTAASGTPSSANHAIVSILDHQYVE
jgi:hypothetical protein